MMALKDNKDKKTYSTNTANQFRNFLNNDPDNWKKFEDFENIQALDLLRALRGADVAAALQHELAPAQGAHPAFVAMAARLMHAQYEPGDEAQARRPARDMALAVQAALLRRHSSDAVFDAFCASRLAEASEVFGALPAGLNLDAIFERAMP